jgi:lysophospholipase L1-like esterase
VRQDTLTYLALGDSYTIGESVEPALRWPVQLAGALRARGVPVADPTIVARTGWTTDELAAALAAAGLPERYDLVSLLIGVNNQYRGRGLEEYRAQFVELLRRAVAFAGGEPGRVVVLSIPDWGVTPFARGRDRERIAREIDAFNAVNREESARGGARWVDVTPISRVAATDPSLTAGDGLHPSGAMYGRWVEAALPVVASMLGGGGER